MTIVSFFAGLAMLGISLTASAAVYKCEEGGRVVYTDRPCMNASKDAKPSAPQVVASAERRERAAPLRTNSAAEDSSALTFRPFMR